MKKYLGIIGVLILTSLLFVACSNGDISSEENIDKEPAEIIDPIKLELENMTIDEKIGQLVVAGFNSYEVDEEITKLIKEKYIGGVILFSRNVQDVNQLLTLNNSLKNLNSENKVPLFISVDEEGGLVSRMPSQFKKIPTNKKIAKSDSSELAYDIGKVIGEKVSALGFNMNFAPVLDINSNPNNPVIGNRSYGNNKEIVTKLGVSTMEGMEESGIIPVVKHFPGHGDTSVDSHYGLPIVNHDLDRLENFEFIPFKEAIDKGADAVMVSHILLSKIDANNPATMSKIIITDILRQKMNFDGLAVTDDMTMGAILNNYDLGEACVNSINAGADLLLICHGYDNVHKVLVALKEAVNNNVISEERINESVYRILSLKAKYHMKDEIIESIDVDEINLKISEILSELK